MSPLQEMFNVVTMVVPSLVSCIVWLLPPGTDFRNLHTGTILLAMGMHLPFSFIYHVLLAMRALRDAVDNLPRKLDQTIIHVVCILAAFALTNTIWYGVLCWATNSFFIFRLFRKDEARNATGRMLNVGCGVGLYCLTMFIRGDFINAICGWVYFCAGGSLFYLKLGGWGYSLSHVCFAGLAWHVMYSAGALG
mmetsp:Transcript_127764/g.255172  ORF Transcript_127764/g.255172 Transcript_127764/m.255172 type:complete len:193 (+) Transcript_127764:200-778(+)